jgi:acetylornithine/succinyldiaminopimelate/putrescine aminotransferase
LLREDLAPALKVGDHGSTFGGNPVAAAAALAVLERLGEDGFLEAVAKKGAGLVKKLKRLARLYPAAIAEVRGLGLMIGVEFKGPAAEVLQGLRERGVLATKAGDKVLRLLPPLSIRPAEIREFLTAFEAVLATGAGVAREEAPHAPA